MVEKLFGLVGAGGFGREVMPLAKKSWRGLVGIDAAHPVFVETNPGAETVNNIELVSEVDFVNRNQAEIYFNIAIADSKVRQEIARRLQRSGCRPLEIIAETSIVMDLNSIGVGSIICDHCIVTSNATIGNFFHSNIYSYVAHDCVIGDFVTFAPRVSCNGNVHIKDHAYIGTGAVLRQGSKTSPLIIGAGAIVGMGAVVTKDVEPGTTVVGNPARPMHKP